MPDPDGRAVAGERELADAEESDKTPSMVSEEVSAGDIAFLMLRESFARAT